MYLYQFGREIFIGLSIGCHGDGDLPRKWLHMKHGPACACFGGRGGHSPCVWGYSYSTAVLEGEGAIHHVCGGIAIQLQFWRERGPFTMCVGV